MKNHRYNIVSMNVFHIASDVQRHSAAIFAHENRAKKTPMDKSTGVNLYKGVTLK